MKENKIIKICVPIVCIFVLVLFVLYPIFNPYIRRAFTLNRFHKDMESMNIIVQEWENTDYKYMFTDQEKYEMNKIDVGYKTNDNMPIGTNQNYFKYILIEKRYQYIMKDGDAIYFTKYSSLGNGYGVAFVVNGIKPQNEFITSCEKIDGFDEWYFYVMR